jgi:hypothetical protein
MLVLCLKSARDVHLSILTGASIELLLPVKFVQRMTVEPAMLD